LTRRRLQILTIGYEGTTLADFLATLKAAGVQSLLDIRELPNSRRKGFSKNAVEHRGLRPSSVGGYDYWIADFLRRSLRRHKPLQSLTTTMLESYVKVRQPELAACTLRTAIQCIRAIRGEPPNSRTCAHRMKNT